MFYYANAKYAYQYKHLDHTDKLTEVINWVILT